MKSCFFVGFFGGIVLLAGCAGQSVNKSADPTIKELPKEFPQELQKKFEIKDASSIPPTPIPTATPVAQVIPAPAPPEKKMKHRSKKKAEVKPASATPPSTVEPSPAPIAYPNRRPTKDPIWIGEKHLFDITYFGMSAGELDLEVLPYKAIEDRKVYHIRGTAISSQVFSLFYRINDSVESFLDYDGLFSHRFHLVLDETKQTRDALELYDNDKRQTFYWNRWNHKTMGYKESKETSPMQPLSQDSLSALFYLRTLPLEDGAVYTFPVVSEGKSWEAVVTVLRREILSTPMGRIRTIVVKPETKYNGVLQKRGDSFLWLTDDDRRFLVRLEAKVKIGSVVVVLKKMEPGTPPGDS